MSAGRTGRLCKLVLNSSNLLGSCFHIMFIINSSLDALVGSKIRSN